MEGWRGRINRWGLGSCCRREGVTRVDQSLITFSQYLRGSHTLSDNLIELLIKTINIVLLLISR